MDESGLTERVVTLRGNDLLRLADPGACWRVESGSLGIFAVSTTSEGGPGRRRFFFEVGTGELLIGVGPTPPGAPEIVAVALEPSTLRREPAAGEEQPSSWKTQWAAILGGDEAPGGLARRVAELVAREAEAEAEQARESDRRGREETQGALAELGTVLARGTDSLPVGEELFLVAHVVARASGITLRRPPPGRAGERGDAVERIAAAAHVRARRVLLEAGFERGGGGPLVAFIADERRPVALVPRPSGAYDLFDPRTRTRRPLDRASAVRLEPGAYLFYRPLTQEDTSGLGLLRFALHGRRRELARLVTYATAVTLFSMFTPQALALLVDGAIPSGEWGLVLQLGLGLLAAAVGSAAFRLAQGAALMRIETAADVAAQAAVWDRLLKLQLSFFRRFSTGDLLSRVTAVSQIRASLSGTTFRTLLDGAVAWLNLGLLLYYSPRLAVVGVAVAVLSALLTIASGLGILRVQRRILELRGRSFGFLVQLVNGVAKLRVAAAEERAFAQWVRRYAELLRLELRQGLIQDRVETGNLVLSSAASIVLFAAASTLLAAPGREGTLSVGVFLAFNVAFGTFVAAVASLSNTVTDVLSIAILRERARPIFEAVPEVTLARADPGRLTGEVELEDVVFQYRGDGPMVLSGVRLRAEPGAFVAVVGPSGSGKSTLFRLLLGFESPRSGAVYYDGQDLAGLDVEAVRRQLGVVLQGGRINAGSIFDNVVCGAQLTLHEAWEAAEAAGFAEEIAAMPMGLHTVISEGGTNLSGGQRQRLLLARALVHRPRLLLLDEATSALDNETQAIVSASLARLKVTRLVIAHRLSTIRQAQRIYVLSGGRVVQEGSFPELAACEGLFARMMARQVA